MPLLMVNAIRRVTTTAAIKLFELIKLEFYSALVLENSS